MASGSRQQSRFISMISDYSKTMELVDAAYNSTGASQRQFEKTLDSLQAKLTKLKNAWDEFTMGLANNELIGFAVEGLTKILELVNGIINGLSGGNGLIKSVLSLTAVIGGLKLGGVLFDSILKSGAVQKTLKALSGQVTKDQQTETSFKEKGKRSALAFKQGFEQIKNKDTRGQFLQSQFLGLPQGSLQKIFSDFEKDMGQKFSALNTGIDATPFEELNKQFRRGQIDIDEYTNILEQVYGDADLATEAGTRLLDYTTQVNQAFKRTGKTISEAGIAFMVLGAILSEINPELGKTVSIIGGVTTALGGLVQAMPSLISGFKSVAKFLKVAPKTLGIWSAVIAGIGIAIIGIVNAVKNASPEVQLEKTQKATDKAKESAEEASKAYEDLADKKKDLTEMETSLNSLTKGSIEWKKAIIDLNNEVLALKETYKDLEIAVGENGQLTISNWDEILKKQLEYSENANKMLIGAQMEENQKQLEVNLKDVEKTTLDSENQQRKKENLIAQNEQTQTSLLGALDSNDDKEIQKKLNTFANLAVKDIGVQLVNDMTGSLYDKARENATKKVFSLSNKNRKKEYEELFGKGSADNLSNAEIKEALINQKTASNYQEKAQESLKLSDDAQYLLGLLNGTSTDSITSILNGTFTKITAETEKEIASFLGITVEQVRTQLATVRENIDDEVANIQESFSGIDSSLYENYSYDVVKNLQTQTEGMGTDTAEAYLKQFSEVMKDESPEIQKQLQNYLSSVDLSDALDVSNARDFMESLGLDKNKIAQFWGEANKYCKAYISSLEEVDTLNEKISNLGKARDLVSEGETTFSEDDKSTLISAGFRDEDFLRTGFDEWTYIGENTNTLLEQIDQKVGVISGQIVQGLENSINVGEQAQGVLEADPDLEKALETLSQYGANGVDYSKTDMLNWASRFGIENADLLSDEGLKKALLERYNLAKNVESNKDTLESQQMSAASLQYEMNGDFGIYTDELNDKQKWSIMQAQLNKVSGAQEIYNNLLSENGKLLNEQDVALANDAVQLAKINQRYKTISSSIDDYKDYLLQGKEAGVEYFSAIANAKNDLSSLFDVDKALLNEDFIVQYSQDIYNLAEGGEVGTQAFRNLWEAIKQIKFDSMIEGLDSSIVDCEDAITDFSNWIEGLDPTIGIGTELSTEGLESGLVLLAQQFHDAGKDAQTALAPAVAMLEELTGTKINIQYEEEEFDSGGRYISAKSMEGLLAQGWHVGKGGKLVRTKAITAVSASKAGSPYDKFVTPSRSSSSKSSSGSDKKDSTWENPYDKLYNLTEKINEALRQREKLEREYDRILERRGSTFGEIRKNYNDQISSLEKEIQLQNQLRAGRLKELKELSSETYKGQDSEGNELIKSFSGWGVTKYANYNPNTGVITIDWSAIDKVKDENTGGAIEAYISRLEELQEQIEDVDTQIEDFQDRILELQKEGMQDYLDFEQKVYDAIVNQQQEIIDNYQDLSDKIADSNKDILDSIQDSIDLQRQIRDNTKTEDDLNEKEARLAYLRRDTSNANLLEIKQLEDELADSRQDYEDSLIDQQLERLTKQNDDAQTAREKQIELMQAQLDYASQNGEFWGKAYELINSGFSADGNLNQASQLWDLLEHDEGWKGMSKFGQLNWQEEISKAILAASQGYANWNMYKAEKVDKSLTLGNGTQLTFDGKNWKDKNGNVYSGVDFDSTSNQFTYSGMTPSKGSGNSGSNSGSGSGSNNSNAGKVGIGSRVKVDPNTPIYATSYGEGAGKQYYAKDPIYNVIGENNGYYLTRYHKLGAGWTGWFRKQDVKAYKTGGLADFTGPAWLDGTKSSPELVLNARDTENFIALKDILSDFMERKTSNGTTPSGDMYFDISINVDELKDDYDVDALTRKIKQDLTDSAMYRNVNLVNLIR